MTPEEAAELVLKADPWTKCPRSESKDHPMDCECDLSGAVLKPEYKEAYRVLGRPQPPVWTTTKLPDGGTLTSGPAVFVGKMPLMRRLTPLSPKDIEPLSWRSGYIESGSSKDQKSDPEKE